jgi:hypothetical protein
LGPGCAANACSFDHGNQRRGLVLVPRAAPSCLPAALLPGDSFCAPVSFKPPEVERKLNNVHLLDTWQHG